LSSAIDGVPEIMPALLQSLKISQKAAACGFEWRDGDQVWKQMESELIELEQAMHSSTAKQHEVKLELGDVFFTLVNVARWRDLDPEEALLLALDKFKRRFKVMEKLSSKPLSDLSTEDLEALWIRAKTITSAAVT
jgi:XTP/dITP diphosphohydrolase